ncbi:DUF4194 domain-containing protein [Desulfoscipio gibsoniae]|uniref:DUF4194 domain-containing protein n=1 Tax=Desulfoscipio gibsoniae DSM 7213 TaxID=767817 RepID=R4KRL4_9FIRM|nr:DUF4194 domain-containing protein [Desulfoscipio gibsoniae]AGL03220.1 hypothetical protein Desgi_3932 [Desulfoscipio gibsoniae DSM 7213]
MEWLKEYEVMAEKEKHFFKECTNTLLAQTYLVAKRKKDLPLYRFCERRFDLIKNYLLLSGWQLNHLKAQGVISVHNQLDNNRHKFVLSDTLFLFIIRLLYDEKVKELNLTQQVIINNRDIYEKYVALNIKQRLPAQDEYTRTLKLFQNHSLVELVSGGWTDYDATIVLYPSLIVAVSNRALDKITEWLQAKADDGGDGYEDFEQTEDD